MDIGRLAHAVSASQHHHHHLLQRVPSTVVKTLVESDEDGIEEEEEDLEEEEILMDPMDITIVEEDGSTSIVEGAKVSSIVSSGGEPSGSSIRIDHGNVTYQLVSSEDYPSSQTATPIQILNQGSSPSSSSSSGGGGGQAYYVVQGRSHHHHPQGLRSFGGFSVLSSKSNSRDEKKRATHNEVERRRRDKINGWIGKLAKIVPSCADDIGAKNQSKGGILAKACEYIGELKSANCRLASTLREHASTAEELDALRREVSELRKENLNLKQQIGPVEDDSTVTVVTTE